MTDKDERVVADDEAGIIIEANGDVRCLMPDSDIDEDDMISSDSPTFKALVIMAFINDKEARKSVTEKLIAEHFSITE